MLFSGPYFLICNEAFVHALNDLQLPSCTKGPLSDDTISKHSGISLQSLDSLVVRSYVFTTTETWNYLTQVCSCLDVHYCSLGYNDLNDTGAIALARALQHNKSLKELE